ncbi:MAG TPA: hypothetical protein VGI40_09590 [Pirellulaceae bacterium]|jgi:hypothetical protein
MPRFFIAAALLATFAGCKADPYALVPVTGKVTSCEGKPAAGGVIVFAPVDDPDKTGRKAGNPGREARGEVGADGTFSLTTIGIPPKPGAVTGPHRITFEMPTGRRPALSGEDKANMTPEEIKKNEADFASRVVFPPLPCSDKIQPEEIIVKADGNNFEFKLPPK